MAYIGNQPTIGQYRKLDDISGSFNGSLTAFTMQVGSTNVNAGSVFQLLISLGGVIQNPGTDFTVSGSTLTFTTAPTSGLDFFGILMGQPLNTATPGDSTVTGAKIVDGTITGAKLAAGFNYDSGLLFLDDTNNRVGLGTSTPSQRLTVFGAGASGSVDYVATFANGASVAANNAVSLLLGDASDHRAEIRATTVDSNNGTLSLYTLGSGTRQERLRIGNDGSLQLRNSPGIDFSQIQTNAAGMTSETLDSYEEGTWTPSLGGTTVYYTRQGFYTKIGNLVYVYCNIHVNTIGTGSPTTINGLPFTPGLGEQPIPVSYFDSVATSVYWFSFQANLAGTLSSRAQTALDGTSAQVNIFGNTTQVVATGVYKV